MKMSVLMLMAMFTLIGCKKFTNPSNSEIEKYENVSGDICGLIADEAKLKVSLTEESLETIQLNIISREKDILELLLQKASVCQANKDLKDLACNAILSNATEFNYDKKLKDLNTNCNIVKVEVAEVNDDLEDFQPSVEDLDGIEAQFDDLSSLPIEDIEASSAGGNYAKLRTRTKIIEKLTTYCSIAAKLVGLKKSQSSTTSTLSSRTIRFCSSKPIQIVCSGLVTQTNETLAALSEPQPHLFKEASKSYYTKHTKSIFNSDLKECIKGVKKDVAKKLAKETLKSGSKKVVQSLFQESIKKFSTQGTSLLKKLKLTKGLSQLKTEICAFALGNVGKQITKVPHEEWSSSQSCVTAGKQGQERLSACLQTGHQICQKISGYVDLEAHTGSLSDSDWGKVLAGVGEFGISTAATALPPVSLAVAGMVDEMDKGIKSLFGDGSETNAFLECTIGPAARCLSANFTAWSLGFELDDLKKPVDTWKSEKNEPEYIVRDFCVCDRQCYMDDIGYDTPFGDAAKVRTVVPTGSAGTRQCATKEDSFYTGRKKNGWHTYAYQHNCKVLKARVKSTGSSVSGNAAAFNEIMEFQENGKWKSIFTPSPQVAEGSVSQQRTSLQAGDANSLYPTCLR